MVGKSLATMRNKANLSTFVGLLVFDDAIAWAHTAQQALPAEPTLREAEPRGQCVPKHLPRSLAPDGFFHPFPMSSPLVGFGEAGVEIRRRRPGPERLRIHGRTENVLILFAFAFRPDLDEHGQLERPTLRGQAGDGGMVAGNKPAPIPRAQADRNSSSSCVNFMVGRPPQRCTLEGRRGEATEP